MIGLQNVGVGLSVRVQGPVSTLMTHSLKDKNANDQK